MPNIPNTVAHLDYATCRALKAAVCTSEERPILNHVHLGRGRAEATNGYVLCRVPVVDEQGSEFFSGLPPEVRKAEWLLHRDVLGLVKSKCALQVDLATGECRVVGKGEAYPLDLPHAVPAREAGPYPDTDHVIPTPNGTHRKVCLGAPILKALANIAGKDCGGLIFYVPVEDKEGGHVQDGLRFRERGGPRREGVAMPMRILD